MITELLKPYLFNSREEFELLSDNVKNDFFSQMVVRKFKKGQNIFVEGTYPAGLFYIKNGNIKKYKTLTTGKEQTIFIYGERELIGYAALLSQETYPDSAKAITDAEVGFVSAQSLSKLFEKYDDLFIMLTKNLGHEFGALTNILTINVHKSLQERLAFALIILSVKMNNGKQEKQNYEISISRRELANYVGTALESLVRQLSELRKDKIITILGKKIIINDMQKLIKIANIQ